MIRKFLGRFVVVAAGFLGGLLALPVASLAQPWIPAGGAADQPFDVASQGGLVAIEVTRAGSDGAGATTSSAAAVSGAIAVGWVVVVEPCDASSATVGFDDDDGVVTLTAEQLAAGGMWTYRGVDPASGTRQPVVTLGGSPTAGSVRAIVEFVVPST